MDKAAIYNELKHSTDVDQKLKDEHQRLKDEIRRLHRDLGRLEIIEDIMSRYALETHLYEARGKERDIVQADTRKLSEEVNKLETLVQKPLKQYKDIKASVESYTNSRSSLMKALNELDSHTANLEKLSAASRESIANTAVRSKVEITKVEDEGDAPLGGLQAQLKILETRKRTLQSQTSQRTEQNTELTKICDDLLCQQ